MNTKLKKATTLGIVAVVSVLGGGNGFMAPVHAQTTSSAVDTVVDTGPHNDFERELLRLIEELRADIVALQASKTISSSDIEKAGDRAGNNVVIDGEKSENEIENEIDNEVEQESPESEKSDNENRTQIREEEEDNSTSTMNQELRGGDNENKGQDGGNQSDGESN
ncbi:MAG: hypothetical protein WCW78_03105 [Candidatus Paceibacterota bacterium]|jgi:ABC-type uncharacterized transport system ATPase subunit